MVFLAGCGVIIIVDNDGLQILTMTVTAENKCDIINFQGADALQG